MNTNQNTTQEQEHIPTYIAMQSAYLDSLVEMYFNPIGWRIRRYPKAARKARILKKWNRRFANNPWSILWDQLL